MFINEGNTIFIKSNSEVSIKRTRDKIRGRTTHIQFPSGESVSIFRDPDDKMWYRDDDLSFVGTDEKESIERIIKKFSSSKMGSLLSLGDKISGGLSDGQPDSDFDSSQLKSGIEIEREHTQDRDKAKEIAKDHLTEDPKYYTHLKEMEAKYKRGE